MTNTSDKQPLLSESPEESTVSFKQNIDVIKENMRRTIDPGDWILDGLSDLDIANNIKRNKAFVGALTSIEKLKINGEKVEGEAISLEGGTPTIGNKAVYLGMGGRVICEFETEVGERLLPAIFDVKDNKSLPVSKGFDKIKLEEEEKGVICVLRSTSTHIIGEDGEEKRGIAIGVKSLVDNKLSIRRPSAEGALDGTKKSFQIGVNMSVGGIGKDRMRNLSGDEQIFKDGMHSTPSGSFAHALFVCQKKDDTRGTLMIGIENTSYGAKNALSDVQHDLSGKSGDKGAFWGNKHRDPSFSPNDYQNNGLIKPILTKEGEPINSMRANLDQDVLKKITLNIKKYETFALDKLQEKFKANGMSVEAALSRINSIKSTIDNVDQVSIDKKAQSLQSSLEDASESTSTPPPTLKRSLSKRLSRTFSGVFKKNEGYIELN